jgi:hypothetical protein
MIHSGNDFNPYWFDTDLIGFLSYISTMQETGFAKCAIIEGGTR